MRLSSIASRNLLLFLTAAASLSSTSLAASPSDSKSDKIDPCTIHSLSTGSFYDLRPLTLAEKGTKTQAATNESFHARGYDYGSNFTINICAPVVEAPHLDDVYGLSKKLWANISAYYTDAEDGTIYSIGQMNNVPTVRGRKLLLNYTNGSPCPDLDEYGDPLPYSSLNARKLIDDDDDDDNEPPSKGHKSISKAARRHKSTMLSFICDTSPLLSTTPRISFLGTFDHCSYVFEVRSRYACAGATPSQEKGTLGPAGVFAMILVIGILAYLVGGIVYQRNVMHQRGWRQLPNYSLWAGIFSFISVCTPAFL